MTNLILCLLLSLLSCSSFAIEIRYPNIDGVGKKSLGYQILQAILSSEKDVRLKLLDYPVNQDRARQMLLSQKIDIADFGVKKEFDNEFQPVRLPIDRGILGWRIFIINKGLSDQFAKVKSITDLRKFTAGQGAGWGDIKILNAAGIRVETGTSLENLFKMTEAKRFEFLPLGANESHGLLRDFSAGSENLMVEENIVLHYPFGRFFYLRKSSTLLQKLIKSKLEHSLQSGELQKILENHSMFKDAFSKAHLGKRIRIKIDSPGLPNWFKEINPKWWYRVP